ncbi:MAG: hypothetical protein DCC56_02915 [Anaerolineae bacterium]|nr:MAG: hypothetical protein DCC56_02915 [Anaerolineae bacterium]
MVLGAAPVTCEKNDNARNTARGGGSAQRESSWRQLPLWPRGQVGRTSRLPSSRSYYLWVRVRSSLSFCPGAATEQEFVRWMKNALGAAEFGALSLAWVKENAKRDLRLHDEQLFRWLVRHCLGNGEFKSDGVMITMRE